MELTQQHRDDFVANGNTLIDDVLPLPLLAGFDRAIGDLYDRAERRDGIISYPDLADLFPLYQRPELEQIAQFILESDEVVINSAAILFKRPTVNGQPGPIDEHVDIMYSREEWLSRPRRVICMLMVMLADLPAGRANTYVRPGSHMMLAEWLAREGREPVKAKPTHLPDLPELAWAAPQPVVAKAGQVLAFNTNLIHGGSANLDCEPRRIMFINFSARPHYASSCGNYDRAEERRSWRLRLRGAFALDRQHLMAEA